MKKMKYDNGDPIPGESLDVKKEKNEEKEKKESPAPTGIPNILIDVEISSGEQIPETIEYVLSFGDVVVDGHKYRLVGFKGRRKAVYKKVNNRLGGK